jgi:Zn/Cd-binding protein ZinT
MYDSCKALTHAPALNTRNCTDFSYMFGNDYALQEVPLYNTVNADNVRYMFSNCKAVESGALSLYTQMSTQTVVPTTHTDCFIYCGRDTVTGSAELAQIPTSWGGTMSST